jgi:hypothetical protein
MRDGITETAAVKTWKASSTLKEQNSQWIHQSNLGAIPFIQQKVRQQVTKKNCRYCKKKNP